MPELQVGKKRYSIAKSIGLVTLISGAIIGLIEGVIFGVREYDQYQYLKKEVQFLRTDNAQKDSIIRRLSVKLNVIDNHIEKEKESYAVGFRVVFDDRGKKTKTYRDWDGELHSVFRDEDYLRQTGYEYYFYIDANTGLKKYVTH
jgi:hypothetical protein